MSTEKDKAKQVNQEEQAKQALALFREERRCNAKLKNGGFCPAITNNILCSNGKWRCRFHCGDARYTRARGKEE